MTAIAIAAPVNLAVRFATEMIPRFGRILLQRHPLQTLFALAYATSNAACRAEPRPCPSGVASSPTWAHPARSSPLLPDMALTTTDLLVIGAAS